MILALIIACLFGGGTYLIIQQGMIRIILGLTLISHATNLLLLATGVAAWRREPLANITSAAEAADPLPQAFVLTAIVISFAVTVFMLTLALIGTNDDTSQPPQTGEEHDI